MSITNQELDTPSNQGQEAERQVGVFHDSIIMEGDPESATWQDASHLECSEFLKSGYLKNEAEYHKEYDPYNEASIFVGIERNGDVVGVSRFIVDSDIGFMTINDAKSGGLTIFEEAWKKLDELDMRAGFEVATIAVPEEFRTIPTDPLSVSASIYAAVLYMSEKLARAQARPDRGFVIASFDEEYLDRFQKIFGDAVTLLGPPQNYKGSLTVPVMINPDIFMANEQPDGLNELLAQLALLTQDHAN